MGEVSDYLVPKSKVEPLVFQDILLAKMRLQVLQSCPRTVREYQLPLTVTFVDFKKAFDSINRTDMFPVLRQCGIPNSIVNAIKVLYSSSSSAVMVDGSISEPSDVTTGVLQGDVLPPSYLLFLLTTFWVRHLDLTLEW